MSMGTRADFYVGKGKSAEWLGSTAWDGYPAGIPKYILKAKTETAYRKAVARFIEGREDGTKPEQGWPWPWDDSNTTDYAYAFSEGRVEASCFGRPWFNPNEKEPADPPASGEKYKQEFPNMKERKKVDYGKRSGVIFITVG
jgi:hypothetical protein